MKIFLELSAFFFLGASCELQAQCLTNGDFSGACGDQVYTAVAPTWSDACGDGWVRSHGTPQMFPYSTTDSKGVTINTYYAYMWSAWINGAILGEGMYTPYSFQANQTYQVRIVFAADPVTAGGSGTVNVYAANGLTQSVLNGTGNPTPSISSLQSIGSYVGNTGWTGYNTGNPLTPAQTDQTFTFTANGNYSQLWIYPSATSVQYNLQVFLVKACPACPTNTLNYTSGILPAGNSYAAYINAGSGSTTAVTILPDQATSLTAVNVVDLLPGFQATVTTTGNFSAIVSPCTSTTSVTSAPDQYDSIIPVPFPNPSAVQNQMITNQPNQLMANNPGNDVYSDKLIIYPSVSNGVVNVSGSNSILANSEIIVIDQSGRPVYKVHNEEGNNITLYLGNLTNGIYFVQVRNDSKSSTQKIIISK